MVENKMHRPSVREWTLFNDELRMTRDERREMNDEWQ